jgi:hypothetical protein
VSKACGWLRKDLLEKEARLHVAGWHCRIWTERTSWPKAHTFVETDRLLLMGARFEAQDRLVCPTNLVLDSAQKSLRNSSTAHRWPRVHPFDLGVLVKHRDSAAPDRDTIQPRHKEAHIRLKDLLNRKAVPLMGVASCSGPI